MTQTAEAITYSIVMPAYNEEDNLPPLLERIHKVMPAQSSFEIIVVDNGSFDGTPLILEDLMRKYPTLVAVTLTRNFGYDGAIAAGLEFTRGQWTIIMDGDQQDPPEVIPQLIEKTKEGFCIVYGLRKKRTEHWLIGLQMKIFYNIWKKIANIHVPKDAGNFCIIHRDVVKIINCLPERNKFIRGLRAWTGYPATGIVYERQARNLGETKFSYFSYIGHALNGFTSFSTVPLRIITYVGLLGLLASVLIGFYLIAAAIKSNSVSGLSLLSLFTLCGMSLNLLGLGIVGEYVGRTLEEVKRRPNFLVRKVSGAQGLISNYGKALSI